MKISVVFLIRSLEPGGAERQLVELVKNLDKSCFDITIVTFYPGGLLEEELQQVPDVRVWSAHKGGSWDTIGFIWRLGRLVRRARPHIVHGYMYGANELAWLLGRAAGARVVWGIRASNVDLSHYNGMTRILFKSGAWLSRRIDMIIANSRAGREHHLRLGYASSNFLVIPNGIDTAVYRAADQRSARVRAEWNITDAQPVIGLVARLDPMKDHETFLKAAALAARSVGDAVFVAVGAGTPARMVRLEAYARKLGIAERVKWAGVRSDIADVYRALDVATSSSAFGEGFSNSLAEAMACETVCVATDVGDAREVLGDTGVIVPPGDHHGLAQGWIQLLDEGASARAERGRRARARVVEHFSVEALALRTGALLRNLAPGARPVRPITPK